MFIQFAELPVTDQDRAKAFYTEALGLSVVSDAPMGADGWRWIELGFPGAQTHLHFIRKRADHDDDEPVLVLVDEDVKGAVERLRARDVKILTEPMEAPWQPGRIVAEFMDSEGNRMVIGTPEG